MPPWAGAEIEPGATVQQPSVQIGLTSRHLRRAPDWTPPQSTYLYKRWNRVSVSAHSAGAYTATLLVRVNAPPTLTSQGKFYPHDWMYARKQRLQLCVLCGRHHTLNIRHNLLRRRLFWMSSSQEASCYRMSHFSVSPLTAGLAAISSSSRESLTEALTTPVSPFSPVSSGAAVWRAQSCSSAVPCNQGVRKRCRLSWLTNSALVYEPKCGERGGGLWGLSQSVQLYTEAQINFGDLSPYLPYTWNRRRNLLTTVLFDFSFSERRLLNKLTEK